MATTAAPGFLVPLLAPIPYDDALLDLLQPIVVGIGGYSDPTLVRPGWQFPDTPNQPDYTVDWAALRIADIRSDTFSYEAHVPTGNGYDVLETTEEIDLLLSCYGPHAQTFMKVLRDGFQLGQNRSYLKALNMDLLSCAAPRTLPALLHGQWLRRVDMTVTLRRYCSQQYGVNTLLDLTKPGTDVVISGLDNGQYITPITPTTRPIIA